MESRKAWIACARCLLVAAAFIGCTSAKATGAGGSGGSGGDGGDDTEVSCDPPDAEIDGACVTSGVPADACPTGFEADMVGGCPPILPAEPCADGQVALMGQTTCRALIDCGTDKWSNIPVEVGTEYVDASYAGNDSDGSQERPWLSVQDAVLNAASGDIIALAEGDYAPPVQLPVELKFWGRCPSLVQMDVPPIASFFIDVSDTEIHQISFTSVGTPIIIADAENVLLDRVWIHDTGDAGIIATMFDEPTSFTLQASLVERASSLAIVVLSADADIVDTVVRDTLPNDFGPGRGVDVEQAQGVDVPSNVTFTRSIIRNAKESGFACLGATCTLTESVIIDTEPRADGRFGTGIAIQYSFGDAFATVIRSYIGQSHTFGISVVDASLTLTESTIEDVARQPFGDDFGDGVVVLDSDGRGSVTVLERSRIAGAARAGVASFAATVTIEDVALACNTISLDGEYVVDRAHDYTNLGGNVCWCGATAVPCKVLESMLKPPQP